MADVICSVCGEPMYRDRYSKRIRTSFDMADREAYFVFLCKNKCEVIPDISYSDDDEDEEYDEDYFDDDDDEALCDCCS